MHTKNSLLSHLYNRFDIVIRFIYTQTPIGSVIANILSNRLYQSDSATLHQVFQNTKKIIDSYHLTISRKKVLEIGPGTSLITALNFLDSGATKVFLLDKYPRQKNIQILTPSPEELSYFPKPTINKYLTKSGSLKPKLVEFHQKNLADFKESVHIIFTKSVLEHVVNPTDFINQTYRVLKPKGFAYHWIDLRDHYNFDKPFLFYKYPDWVWTKFLTKPSRSYTNRFRYHQFILAFKSAGFKIIYTKTNKSKLAPNQKINTQFRDTPKSSLETTILQILVQKN